LDSGFLGFLKGKKKTVVTALLILLGLILILSSSFSEDAKNENRNETITLDEYKERLEEEIRELCSSVDGVGKCRVTVTFERGEQNVYKGSSVIETKPPRVQGISVVCRGGDSDSVRIQLTELLTALFDIGSNRVAILKLNS
jgi:stage III sporulation protein AG